MLVQATEIQYDYPNERVVAVGNVQIYYKGSTVQADKIIYDQRTKHLQAEGNVRLTGPDGVITYGDLIDLSDDLRNGFIDSLRLETADQTRFAAARGTRTEGNYTVLESGVYTACEPCRTDPRKPPLWQVKAARIIHNQTEKMIYFEDARIEFFGVPLAYSPYLAAPDPTVKRKSGFLMPLITTNSIYGFGVETPYYLALAPSYDMTFSPRIMSKQGPLLQTEFRQRLEDGSYTIRGAGLYQTDKDEFANTDGFKTFRGSVETTGRFNLSPRWAWGWDGVLVSDPTFFADYRIRTLQSRSTELVNFFGQTEGVSQLFLAGRGDRSYFDVRAIHYTGFTSTDQQAVLPNIHPVLDYEYTFNQPVLGGELGYSVNLTSLSREKASFDPISQTRRDQRAVQHGDRRHCGQDKRELSSARRSRRLFPPVCGEPLADQIHRFIRPGVHAVPFGARRRRTTRGELRSGRLELHRHRRQRRHPLHGDRRHRLPLSLHLRP